MIRLLYTRLDGEDEHVIGHALASKLIFEHFGANLTFDSRGKPGVDRDGCFVGISHSRGFCAAAIADFELGLDIELRDLNRPPEKILRLARRFFAPDEYERLTLAGDLHGEFFERWCAKESYVKFTGNGLSQGLTSFSTLDGRLGVQFVHFTLGDCHGCVCAPSDIAAIELAPAFINVNNIIPSTEDLS